MPVSNSFLDMLRELFSPVGQVVVRKMFGGAGVYADGVMFALLDGDTLYLKGDEKTAAKFEAEGCNRFTYDGKTRPVSMSYWRAPERLFDDPDEMAEWAREAIGIARSEASRKAAKSQPKAKAAAKRTKGGAPRS